MTYLGVDSHKRWTQIAAIDGDGRIIAEGRLPNTRDALTAFLKDLPKPFRGVVESSLCWTWVHDTLVELGVDMILAHPLMVRAIAAAKIKTDKVDARMLAQLLRANLIPQAYVRSPEVREQRRLWRERIWLVRMRTRLKNRIKRLLTVHNVATPDVSDLFGVAGRKFLTAVELPPTMRRTLNAQLKLLEIYNEQIKEAQGWAAEASAGHPYVSYLETIPGLGKVFAPIVALEIDNIDRFANAGRLASYSCLVPRLYQSSETTRFGSIGRQGNVWLKWVFVEAAWVAVSSSPYFQAQYLRLRRMKGPQIAIIACARKLSEVAFHVLKEQRPYQERAIAYA